MSPDHERVARIASGAAAIDEALGGGWPRGRIVEVFGKENSGKRSIALAALSQLGVYEGAWIELRGEAFDASYATACGWRYQDVTYMSTERSLERALEYAEKLVRSGNRVLVVVSGVETLKRGELIDQRRDTQRARRLTEAAHATGCTVMFLREEERTSAPFSPSPSAIGNALRFYGSVRVHVAAHRWCEGGKAGALGYGHVVKNKCGPVFARFGFLVQHSRGLTPEDRVQVVSP